MDNDAADATLSDRSFHVRGPTRRKAWLATVVNLTGRGKKAISQSDYSHIHAMVTLLYRTVYSQRRSSGAWEYCVQLKQMSQEFIIIMVIISCRRPVIRVGRVYLIENWMNGKIMLSLPPHTWIIRGLPMSDAYTKHHAVACIEVSIELIITRDRDRTIGALHFVHVGCVYTSTPLYSFYSAALECRTLSLMSHRCRHCGLYEQKITPAHRIFRFVCMQCNTVPFCVTTSSDMNGTKKNLRRKIRSAIAA